jgi:hypothetical protein
MRLATTTTIGSFGSNAFWPRLHDPPALRDDGTAPPDIIELPPPPADLGLGSDWMFAQRDATYDASREVTVQRRLVIRYRITPVFSDVPPPQTISTPPNIQAIPLAGS